MEALLLQLRGSSADVVGSGGTLADELEVLQSIYGAESIEPVSPWAPNSDIELAVTLPWEASDQTVKMHLVIPCGYPAGTTAPTLTLVNRSLLGVTIDHNTRATVDGMFGASSVLPWTEGESVLFQGIDTAIEVLRTWSSGIDQKAPVPHESERSLSQIPSPPPIRHIDTSTLVRSDSIMERKSEFLGHAVKLHHPDDVRENTHARFLTSLPTLWRPTSASSARRTRRSTRGYAGRLMACYIMVRKPADQDCDDDGEAAAGGRLAHLLELVVCLRTPTLTPECRQRSRSGYTLVWWCLARSRAFQAHQPRGTRRTGSRKNDLRLGQ